MCCQLLLMKAQARELGFLEVAGSPNKECLRNTIIGGRLFDLALVIYSENERDGFRLLLIFTRQRWMAATRISF